MTHLSLFTGIGGIDIAAEVAGFKTVGQCENNPYAVSVLAKRWPGVPRWWDIKTLTKESFYERTGLRTVDVISGGFPCQPFSVAGKQKGKSDARHLWPDMLRVIEELEPAWVVAENVPGILRIAGDDVCASLHAAGYDVGVFCFEAAAVGAPHRRERVFFVGNSMRGRLSGDIRWWASQISADGCQDVANTGQLAAGKPSGGSCDKGQSSKAARIGTTTRNGLGDSGKTVPNSNSAEIDQQLCEPGRPCGQSGEPVGTGQETTRQANGETGDYNTTRLCATYMANTDLQRREEQWQRITNEARPIAELHGQIISDTASEQWQRCRTLGQQTGLDEFTDGSAVIPHPDDPAPARLGEHGGEVYTVAESEGFGISSSADWWAVEPDVGRVAYGIPSRVDRLKCLGNAVVPAQIYPIFAAIAAIESERRQDKI